MDRYFGFDLGDAESAVAVLDADESGKVPRILPIGEEKSVITAYARTTGGALLVGEQACYQPDVVKRRIRFKGQFLTDQAVDADVRSFASGVLGGLYEGGALNEGEEACFYIGCPAGWDPNARERYRDIFERAGFPPAKIVSESRAALVSACQSKHLQVGYDILSRPVLVVDIGSSTTDFAYISAGKEVQMQTAGEVALGGGIMDEILLELAVSESADEAMLRDTFAKSEPWRSYCEFAARRLKEQYFSDEAYWSAHPLSRTVEVFYDTSCLLTIRMDASMAEKLTHLRWEKLGNRSFREVFLQSLKEVRSNISGELPELIFLTGGVSKHPLLKTWCRDVFPESIVISGTEPEFAVARGLAWSGRIDGELKLFKKELDELVTSSTVEDIVAVEIPDLYREAVGALVEPLLREVAVPVFDRWRSGEIARLSDTDREMQRGIAAFLKSDEARRLLEKPIAAWLRPVSDQLEEYTVPICVRHDVPYKALSLKSYLSASDMEVQIEAKQVFAVGEITWLIDSIISIMVGLLCGGSGIALISSGPTGILAGAAASLAVLLLGKEKMEKTLLHANLPRALRRLVPKSALENRLSSISAQVRRSLYQSLEQEKNEEIIARMTSDIAEQIEQCLLRMAEVVEIPLG